MKLLGLTWGLTGRIDRRTFSIRTEVVFAISEGKDSLNDALVSAFH